VTASVRIRTSSRREDNSFNRSEHSSGRSPLAKKPFSSTDEALSVFGAAGSIPVRPVSVDIPKALELAIDYNLYAYDAYFLQCARYLSCRLIAPDKRMKEVAHDLNIEVLE
jgi:predicted nucleic acid-binding protein